MTNYPLVWRGRFVALAAAAGLAFVSLAGNDTAVAQTALPPPSHGEADTIQDRLEALEAQLRDQTAQNESIQQEVMNARREQERLQRVVGELTAANQALTEQLAAAQADLATRPPARGQRRPAAATQTPAPVTTPAPNTAAAPSGLNAAQQAATGTLGTVPANAAAPGATPAAAPAAEPGPVYSRARELLVRGNYAEAEAAFSDFLRDHPNADTAPDARFWFAFTLLARNNFQDAATNFVDYLRRYPQGPRAPEAHVRLGMALAGLGQNRQACTTFGALPTRYPRASATVRDLALREARALNCA